MKKLFNKKNIIRLVSAFLVISILFLIYGNFSVDVEKIRISSDKIPDSFNEYLIAHVSDYHNRASSLVDEQILKSLTQECPDIIVLTGDLVDGKRTDVDTALAFVNKLCEVAPVYYVTGNHESDVEKADSSEFDRLINGLSDSGVTVLRNDSVKIQNSFGDYFNLYGIEDPYFYGGYEQVFQTIGKLCDGFTFDENEFNVMLSHHPETLSVYSKYYIDLVFSGHAHGGQVTFFGKAIMAPDQVLFPPYTSGLYQLNNTQLILSRGIGYSVFPIRIFCRPHLVYAELETE